MRGRNGINGANGANGTNGAREGHEGEGPVAAHGVVMALSGRGAVVRQQSLAAVWRCHGTGLHSGASCALTLHPAAANHGIVFTDGKRRLAAHWRRVRATHMQTVVRGDGFEVCTVEHLLAALAGCGVDNALVEVKGPEVPAMDGSALPFVEGIGAVGLVAQDAPRRYLALRRRLSVGGKGGAFMEAVPADVLDVTCSIDFPHPAIGRQTVSYRSDVDSFKACVAGARTFGALADKKSLHAVGLAQGACEGNAIVLGADGVLNREGLRCPDEFVRHKLLDAIGDLYLAGAPLLARLRLSRCGHGLHHAFLEHLFARPEGWEWRHLEAPSAPSSTDMISASTEAVVRASRAGGKAHESHHGRCEGVGKISEQRALP